MQSIGMLLIAQRSGERPGAAEKDLEDAVGKKIQSHVRNDGAWEKTQKGQSAAASCSEGPAG